MSTTLTPGARPRISYACAGRHTGYGLNQCIIDETDGYLIGLETPDNETVYR